MAVTVWGKSASCGVSLRSHNNKSVREIGEVPNLTQCVMCVYTKSKTSVDRTLEKCKRKITSARMHYYKPPVLLSMSHLVVRDY